MPILFRTGCFVLACVCFRALPAWALDPAKLIAQYAHTSWRAQDGFFRANPYNVVQTRDGYLWIGTDAGLVRFDGVRFLPWDSARDGQLPNNEVMQLLAARDGGLWIATSGGLSHWKNQRLTNYPTGPGGATSVLEDRAGSIWFARRFPDAEGRVLCEIVEGSPRCLGSADGVPELSAVKAMIEDRRGRIWLAADTQLVGWSRESQTAYRPRGLQGNAGALGVSAVIEASDGTFWAGIAKTGPGLGLLRLAGDRPTPFVTPAVDGSTIAVAVLHLDRGGALWIGTVDRGLYRVHGDRIDHFDRSNGLSGDYVSDVTEDREGSIWVATPQGIDRFSDTPVVGLSARDGLCSPEAASVLATRDGSIWTGGERALTRIRGSTVTCLRAGRELPGSQVTSLFEDHAGRLWVGLDDGLWVYERGQFTKVQRAGGKPIGMVTSIAEDAARQIWIVASGPRLLMRVAGLSVQQEYPEPQLPRRVAADPKGGLWLGLLSGDLARLDGDRVSTYQFELDEGTLLHHVEPQSDGSVLAATNHGLIAIHNGRQSTLTARNGLPCDAVHAMIFDMKKDLWLFLGCGLIRIDAADVQRWQADPDALVKVRLFDEWDGVRVGRAPFEAAARSTDGKLWFATGLQLQTIDPSHIRSNPVRPPVHIEQVIADGRRYASSGVVHLPALTRDLQIDYVALSLVAPQRVAFRYRLEGRDTEWQEPGGRRQAFYSDLRPGTYRFRVIASNNDDLWNEEGAALDIAIAPAWYQTTWFLAVAIASLVAITWALYQLRVRQVARALTARFDERLAERTRLARDIHDTLLQTVQGSKMVADDALERPNDAAGLRRAMQQVSMWLGQAASEGRVAVNALRTPTFEGHDLEAAFRRAVEDCRRLSATSGTVTKSGTARELHPVVRDEVYRIGYEAIRNACLHSEASRIDVTLEYGNELTLRISDNGVGIDAAVIDSGRAGHFGLRGMRERAERIGAIFTLQSRPATGTIVTLIVPGRSAFRRA